MKTSAVLLALLTPLALAGCASTAGGTTPIGTTTSTSTASSSSTTSSGPTVPTTAPVAPGPGLAAALNTLAVNNKAIPSLDPIRTQVDAGNKQLDAARTALTSMRSNAYANPHNCGGARSQLAVLESATGSATQDAASADQLIVVRRQTIADLLTAITAVEAATTAQGLALPAIPTVQAAVTSGQSIVTKETDSTSKSAAAAATVTTTASQLVGTANQVLATAHC